MKMSPEGLRTNLSKSSSPTMASAQFLRIRALMKLVLPTRALSLLMLVGMIDLVATAWMHANGLIVELNPLMRVFIERSEWLFAFVKGGTLIAAWAALAWYAKYNRNFVRKACLIGSLAYVSIWASWFFSSRG